MKRILICFCFAFFIGGALSFGALQSEELKVEVEDIQFAITPVGGKMMWDGTQWVPDKNAKIEGSIKVIVSIDGKNITGSCGISGKKEISGTTFYICENGESFWVIGSPTGAVWVEKESLHDPGAAAPFVSDEAEIQELNLVQAVEMAESEDQKQRSKGIWDIWKIKFGEELQPVLDKLKNGSIEEKTATANKLAFIHHPNVKAALIDALDNSENPVKEAAEKALLKLGQEISKN